MNETTTTSPQQTAAAAPKPGVLARVYAAFDALPRVGKWITAALALLVVSQVFRFFVIPVTQDLNKRADRAALLLESASMRAEELSADIESRAVVFGPNALPGRDITEKERTAVNFRPASPRSSAATWAAPLRSSSSAEARRP